MSKLPITKTESDDVLKFKGVIYGYAGVGKTSLAATLKPLGKGLIISGEAGLKTLYGQKIDVYNIKTGKDLSVFVKTAKEGHLDEYDWFFVDSITEVAKIYEAHFFKLYSVVDEDTKVRSVPEKGSPANKGKNKWDFYGDIGIYLTKFIRDVRNLDKHVFFSALVNEKQDSETKQDMKMPRLIGNKAPEAFNGDMDFVFAYRVMPNPETPRENDRVLFTETIDGWTAKARIPISNTDMLPKAIINPNLAEIVDVIMDRPSGKSKGKAAL